MVNFKSVLPIFLLIGLVGCSGDPVKAKIETAMLTHIEDQIEAQIEFQINTQKAAQGLVQDMLNKMPEGDAKAKLKLSQTSLETFEDDIRSILPTDMSVTVIEHDCSDTNDNVSEIVCTVKYERSAKMYGVKNSKSVNSQVTFSQVNGVWKQESET